MTSGAIVKTKKLSVIYFMGRSNQVNALVDASIEIFPGEFVIFFGPSGCGKSTLLYAIAGLETNIQGDIYIAGNNLAKFNQHELEQHHQKQMGMIFQAYYLIPSLTVLKNVCLPQYSLRISKKRREKKSMELLEHFGVKAQADKFPNELSGGQQQRVAICRSLINDPDMILADEPTGNLDSKSAHDVMLLLKDLNEKQKKTVILVTHSPTDLNTAHRVFYMKDGRVTETKVNRPLSKEKGEGVILTPDKTTAGKKPKLIAAPKIFQSSDFKLLAKTFTNFSETQQKNSDLLADFKAKEIVADILTEMRTEEITALEYRVKQMLTAGVGKQNGLKDFLDRSAKNGGLNMDSRRASRLAEKIKDIVKKIKLLEKKEIKAGEKGAGDDNNEEEINEIRNYLFSVFNVDAVEKKTVERINRAIRLRLNGKTDRRLTQQILDLPLKSGGAGLDRRVAVKMSRRLELLILGKYK